MTERAYSGVVEAAVFALWGLSLALPSRALAAGDPEALLQEGLELRRAGDDQKAYKLFLEAYGQGHSPRATAQLGFCEQALGRWADAETHFSEALRAGSSDAWIRKNRAPIEQSLATVKKQIARLEIVGEPTGAEVLINGAVVGRLPLDTMARVAAGEVEIELRVPGYARATKSIRVEGGRYQKVVLRAEREPDRAASSVEPPPPETPDLSAPSDATADAESEPTVLRSPAARRGRRSSGAGTDSSVNSLRVAAWATGGVALVFLGVGTFEMLAASNKLGEFGRTPSDDDPKKTCGANLPNYGGVNCRAVYSDWENARTIGIAGLVAGGLLAAASVTLFIVSADRPTGTDQVSISCAPSPRDLGFGCAARF